MNTVKRYKYLCLHCGYKGDSTQYFRMRSNSDGHTCDPVSFEDREAYNLEEEDFEDEE